MRKHNEAPRLSAQQLDRAAGLLLGGACGDALGVPYEMGRPMSVKSTPKMIGGGLGPYAPGEYSDDTQMAVCIALVAAKGGDLAEGPALESIAKNFLWWRREGASDIGSTTSQSLSGAARDPDARRHRAMQRAAAEVYRRTNRAGNGSLMRTGVVGLAALRNPAKTAEAARAISDLTHADPLAGDACVIWCEGIRHAVLHGTFDGVRHGLKLIPMERRAQWSAWLTEAENSEPADFYPGNGHVVKALQAAWSAIVTTPIPAEKPSKGSFACQHFENAVTAAVRCGHDTDTVAAIAGTLLGARWGVSAIPLDWQRAVHGWPSLRAATLIRLAVRTAQKDEADPSGWPTAPHQPPMMATTEKGAKPLPAHSAALREDDGVVLGNLALARTGLDVDAVVSLCRVGTADFRPEIPEHDHIQVWLVDEPGANANVHFVIDQAAQAIRCLREEGKRVLLHCAAGRSRTPTVAARYLTLTTGKTPKAAHSSVQSAMGPVSCTINPELWKVVYELDGKPVPTMRANI